jgi:carbon monoxide dehydrogenase subunit G
MAYIHNEILIDAEPAAVWSALSDWGALHERLVPGFVRDTQLDGDARIVTFGNGTVVRELLLNCDEDQRRLSWSIVGGPYAHHNGVAQVFPAGSGRARFVWSADLLPNELAERTAEMMAEGSAVAKQTLEKS